MGEIKKEVGVSKDIKALLLLILDLFAKFWRLINSPDFLVKLVRKLLQKLYEIKDLRVIIKK